MIPLSLGCSTLTNLATPQAPGTTPFFFAVGGSRFAGPRLDDYYIDNFYSESQGREATPADKVFLPAHRILCIEVH